MSKMVIMQILPALQDGGVERGTIEIAAALQKEGIENYVVSSGGKMVPELTRLGVEHITLPVHSKNPFKMWLNSRKIAMLARAKGVTLMHVRSRAPAWSVKWASQRTGIPFITTFHGVYGINPKWLKKPYNAVMTHGKCVIAISNHVRHQIMRDYGTSEDKITLIHRGADINRFDPIKVSNADMADLFQKYDIPLDKPIIMVQGRLTTWKGQLAMLDALKLMKHKNITCLFVGAHQGRLEYVEKMKEKIAALPPETTVQIFSLPGADMPAIYALSDVVASVSLKPEPFGRAMPEAQAMGRIVVAFKHGGACETIEDGKTGFLVEPNNIEALAQKLDEVLSMDLEERKKIQVAAINSVRNYFSVQAMCDKTLAVYKRMHK